MIGSYATSLLLTGRAPACTAHRFNEMLGRLDQGRDILAATAVWMCGEHLPSPAARAGYVRDVSWWLSWVSHRALDVRDVPPFEAELYLAALRDAGLGEVTRAQRTSAVASWYTSLASAGTVARNPFYPMQTLSAPHGAALIGWPQDRLKRALADAAEREGERLTALLALILRTGSGATSLIAVRIGGLGRGSDDRTVSLPAGSGGMRRLALDPFTADAIDAYLDKRAIGAGLPDKQALEAAAPVLATGAGYAMTPLQIYGLIKQAIGAADLARAVCRPSSRSARWTGRCWPAVPASTGPSAKPP